MNDETIAQISSADESTEPRPSLPPALDAQHVEAILQTVPDAAGNVQDVYALSPLQEGILFHHLLNPRDTYVLSMLFELSTRAHVDPLIRALNAVIERHDILRSAIVWEHVPSPVQVVHRCAELPVEEFTLDAARDALVQLNDRMRPGRERLELNRAPLLWLQIAADPHSPRWYAILKVHHIVCDHQSLRVVVAEALAYLEGRERELPAPVPFRTYVEQALVNARSQGAGAFFRDKLATIDEPTAPFGHLDVHGDGSQIEESSVLMDADLSRRVRLQARRSGVTSARLFHAAWGLVAARTSGRHDVVYGTVVLAAMQRSARAQRMLGLSVNTLPLRLRLEGLTAEEFVRHTHEELSELLKHESAPLTLAQRSSGVGAATPLFTSLLNFRHATPDPQTEGSASAAVRVLKRGEAWTNYPITVTIDDLGDDFIVMAKADRRVGVQRTIDYLCTALSSLVDALEQEPGKPALALSVLPESERQRVIHLFNATGAAYPENKLIHELFEEQVRRTPDAVAVAHGERSLTYAELNRRSNQLARHLRSKGVASGQLVGLCVERSIEMLVGLLGVLKAGGAYVPLDPTNPIERIEHLLSDARPRVLLTQDKLKSGLATSTEIVIALDADWREIAQHDDADLDARSLGLSPRDLAYVIYTSGSTGAPKGVMVEHRSLVNYSTYVAQRFDMATGDGSLICSSISFDLMLTGLYPTLLCGRTVRLCREEHGLPLLAQEVMRSRGLAPLKLTPSHATLLEEALRAGQLAGRVKVLVLGGEQLQSSVVELWRMHAPGTRVFNHYGPTETTIGCVVNEVDETESGPVPIGRPIANSRVYILDAHLHEVPIGVHGEIYIAGAGVARGYLNRPDLTEQRFLPDPFTDDPQERMYRTGDVGRWRPDGSIEYLGRNDHQVKIRGYRIELGEIEAQLKHHEQVSAAAVLAREDFPGEKRLVAYIVARESATHSVSIETLRTHLRAILPEYMVPGDFVMIERMPLTPNGKLDRRALPAPIHTADAAQQFEAPRGDSERALAEIWQDLLHVGRVGRRDNFFQLGGHSLLILQMLERLRRLGYIADVRSAFEAANMADLAARLRREASIGFEEIPNLIPIGTEVITSEMLPLVPLDPEQIERIVQVVPGGARNIQDIYPLAPLQEGILFHHLLSDERGDPYVVPMVLSVSGRERLIELIDALQAVINRHDILRTAVLWDQLPQAVQVVWRKAVLPVDEVTLTADRDPLAQVHDWLRPERQRLDLHRAPLLRLQIAKDPRDSHWYVLMQLHHIVCDYASRDIVTSEVVAQLAGRAELLPASVPYRHQVAHALSYARTHDAEAFFRAKLGDITEPTLPFQLMDVHGDGSQIEEAAEDLDLVLARGVRSVARRLGVSTATLFHAAWALAVAATSGRDDVVFGTVLLGRLQGSAGAQRIPGMFINTLPLRLRLRDMAARALIEQTQRELIELLGHEQASLAVAQRCTGISGTAPLFSALLNYRHNAPKVEAWWSGISGIRVLGGRARTNYPLVLCVDDLGEGFRISAQTDRRIEPSRITAHLRTAMAALVAAAESAPDSPVLSLSILPPEEQRTVIEVFNETRAAYPRNKLIHELFEECVQRTPAAIAAVYEQQSLTYAELNGRANQLAHHLDSLGVRPGDFVPVLMSRSLQMLIAQVAVLKCGGVYVPIDPELPAERQAFLIKDCGARCVLTGDVQCDVSGFGAIRQIDCTAESAGIAARSTENLRLQLNAVPPAYVMYTSGSTGVPKGVVVPHYAVNRLVINNGYATIESGDCLAHHSNPAFDASTFEIWGALLNGARVLIVPQAAVLEPEQFAALLARERVTAMYMSVGLFNQYTEALRDVFCKLRYLLVGGESLEPGAIRRVLRNGGPQALMNAYGPTECTTFSTTLLIHAVEEDAKSIPIGRPIANARIYLLDSRRHPVPIGVTGEMYIGGDGVACGYLNRPSITEERFLPDPFSAEPRALMYRTGDLARWRPDGTIDFLGRSDHQVKIRGFRIEVGEIEAQLARHSRVEETAVLAREGAAGEKRLVAYIVPRDSSDPPTAEELRTFLKNILPEYMIPSAFMVLDSMPLTSTGKVDRRALPAPVLGAYATRQYEAPQGELERMLTGIVQALLGVERVGRNDNFFEIGGHSLLALKGVFQINQALGITLKIADAYKYATIAELAQRIVRGATDDHLVDLASEACLDEHIVANAGALRIPPRAILLTGGTGFVGRFLLAQLLEDTNATVYCMVRASSAQDASSRLRHALLKWDLWREDFEGRLVAIPGDLRLPRLGIDAASYDMLAHRVDSLFHCGTSMNHLETYAMAKPANVGACRELLELAVRHRPKLVNYISTLSVFGRAEGSTRVIDERTMIEQERHWSARGYAASKWVGEKIFMLASSRGIPCNIFRLGLVWADTQLGRYDELQREYRILKSCLLSGCGIRDYRYELAPTPVDYVARAAVFLAGKRPHGNGIFHLCAPEQQIEGVFERYNRFADRPLELMSMYEWICEVKRLHVAGRSLPVVPLVQYAFSMDEASFHEHEQMRSRTSPRFDRGWTLRELQQAGIFAPVADDELLETCIRSMLERDADLQDLAYEHLGPSGFGTVDRLGASA